MDVFVMGKGKGKGIYEWKKGGFVVMVLAVGLWPATAQFYRKENKECVFSAVTRIVVIIERMKKMDKLRLFVYSLTFSVFAVDGSTIVVTNKVEEIAQLIINKIFKYMIGVYFYYSIRF